VSQQLDRARPWQGYPGGNSVRIWRTQRDVVNAVMRGELTAEAGLKKAVDETNGLMSAGVISADARSARPRESGDPGQHAWTRVFCPGSPRARGMSGIDVLNRTKDTRVLIIAQISDLHVRPSGQTAYGIDTNAMFADAMRAMRALSPAPDCVLVTGDLTDCGLDAEYEIARAGLATLPMPVFVIPGNHDRREPFRRHLSSAYPYLNHDRPRLDYVDDRFPVRLIGLDSLIDRRDLRRPCAAATGMARCPAN